MKNLISLIDNEIGRRGINAKQMAGELCVSEGTLSRMRYGKISTIDRETLVKMQEGIGDDPELQKQLLVAYLMDQCAGPAAETVMKELDFLKVPHHGSKYSAVLREEPCDPQRFHTTNDEYTPLAERARDLRFAKPVVKLFLSLMELWQKSPNMRIVLKGLAAGL